MATTSEIKIYGVFKTQARDGRVAYAQQIYDQNKKMFITDKEWIPLITEDDIDKITEDKTNKG